MSLSPVESLLLLCLSYIYHDDGVMDLSSMYLLSIPSALVQRTPGPVTEPDSCLPSEVWLVDSDYRASTLQGMHEQVRTRVRHRRMSRVNKMAICARTDSADFR